MTAPDRAVAYGLTEPDNVAEVWSWWSWASCLACGQALGSETQEDLVDYLAEHQARYHPAQPWQALVGPVDLGQLELW